MSNLRPVAMTFEYASEADLLSESAFIRMANLSVDEFRGLVAEGKIPGVIHLAPESFMVSVGSFLRGVQKDGGTSVGFAPR